MDALMWRVAGILGVALLSILPARGQDAPSGRERNTELFARTAAEILQRDFRAVSYLLLDIRTGALLASNWQHAAKPVPVGSLVKPFTAIAYAEAHQYRFPQHICSAGACWLPHGHGRVGIVRATALSCNAYYTQLAMKVGAKQVVEVAQRFGLNGPGATASPEVLIGMHGVWRESPLALARAYAELLGRSTQSGMEEIVEGMTQAAKDGTAAGVGRAVPYLPALAKTGTAPCTHRRSAPGDGFVVVAWPADSPRYLMLVRRHGAPGAQAAVTAGRMLRALEPQR